MSLVHEKERMYKTQIRHTESGEGSRKLAFQLPWDGKTRFTSSATTPLAFDTETEIIEGAVERPVPRLVLATVCDGKSTAVIAPDSLPAFIDMHHRGHWVIHNCAFDFWVVEKYLKDNGHTSTLVRWWQLVDENRLYDSMLLDMLTRLAAGDGERGSDAINPRNLAVVSEKYTGVVVDKTDPYRRRFGELIGVPVEDWLDEKKVEPGFFAYACRDAFSLWRTYPAILREAQRLWREFAPVASKGMPSEAFPDCQRKWGVLTQAIQVKGAIALDAIGRYGLLADVPRALKQRDDLLAEAKKCEDFICRRYRYLTTKYKRGERAGTIRRAPKSKLPTLKNKILERLLTKIAAKVGVEVPLSKGKRGSVSRKLDDWAPVADKHPFLAAWTRLMGLSKQLSFYALFTTGDTVRPQYRVLVRTGRTSCREPNIQQMPREEGFRSLFIPRFGHTFATVDYSFIELVTLAAVCQRMFGYSVLGDVINDGKDPHEYTAASILGMPYEEFHVLKGINPTKWKQDRQAGKAVGFGVPGGLGPNKLVLYAKAEYGVDLTPEKAAEFKYKLVEETYPELSTFDGYLKDDLMGSLAHNLGLPIGVVCNALDAKGDHYVLASRSAAKIAKGEAIKANGNPYNADFCEKVWGRLNRLVGMAKKPVPSGIRDAVRRKIGSQELHRQLFFATITTLTGRIRGGVTYTNAHNGKFQGLAADGAKLACWRLIREGYRVCCMVHDELVVEVPKEKALEGKLAVETAMREAMEEVTGGKIKVGVSGDVADYWKKG